MITENLKKVPLKVKREGVRQFMLDRNWPDEIYIEGQTHTTCYPGKIPGRWRLVGYGTYIGNDWHNHQYVGFRCPVCGMMVQYNWTEPNDGEEPEPLKKLEVIP